jgi:hypothetical protein
MASNFYRQKDGPRYLLGHGLELGFIGLGLIAAFILLFNYKRINKKRQSKIDSGAEQPSAQELSALGDRAVTFRYMY